MYFNQSLDYKVVYLFYFELENDGLNLEGNYVVAFICKYRFIIIHIKRDKAQGYK